MNAVLMLALFLVLLALTAFFNLAEMALVSARASSLARADNAKAANKVLDLKSAQDCFWRRSGPEISSPTFSRARSS